MAQKQRAARRSNSDFPIFDYLEMIAPTRVIYQFQALPRHYRWLIISIIASAVMLWAFLTIVVGGVNHYLATRGEFLYDALYLPYNLEARPLPELPEVINDSTGFVVLPQTIGENYILNIPPSEEEAKAAAEAEIEAFLALSVPVEMALTNVQSTLAEAAATETVTEAVVPTAAAETVPTAAATAAPTIAPTVDTLPIQNAAVNAALLELTMLNDTLAEVESIEPVFAKLPVLQKVVADLAAAGVVLPEADALNARLTELAALERPTYKINDCLMSSKIVSGRDRDFVPVCTIENTATFVERGDYSYNGEIFNVTAAQYIGHEAATAAVKSLFDLGRQNGRHGNYSMDVIKYDYFYNLTDDLYTFAWSHENWVFSITTASNTALEELVKNFPY
jgi:hypothetical protein